MVRTIMEWFLMLWKNVLRGWNALVSKVIGDFRSAPPTEPKAEPTPVSAGGPYRSEPTIKPKKIHPPKDELKLVCTLTNEDAKSVETIKTLKEKTRRRALRHFAGKEVRHRVTEKKPDSIEFAFFRRSSKPVKIRWQKPGAQPEQTPPGV